MDEKYWKQFESSGKIEDYLAFVSHERSTAAKNVTEQVKTDGHAGTYFCDGNDSEDLTRGGIRQTYHPLD